MTCVAELHGWVSLMAGPIMSVTRTWPGSTVIIRVKPPDQRHKARAPRGTSSGAGRAHSVVGAGNTRVARVHPARRRLPRPSGQPPTHQHKAARAARDEQRRGSCALGSWRQQQRAARVHPGQRRLPRPSGPPPNTLTPRRTSSCAGRAVSVVGAGKSAATHERHGSTLPGAACLVRLARPLISTDSAAQRRARRAGRAAERVVRAR